MPSIIRWSAIIAAAFLLCGSTGAQIPPPVHARYDLRPGDHLVYSETIERTLDGDSVQSHTVLRFTSEVIIAAAPAGMLTVGVQRRRESADLLAYREAGKDRLNEQRAIWQKRVAQSPTVASEANDIMPGGAPLHPWMVARESSSRILFAVHEIEELPQGPLKVGDTWTGGNSGIRFKFRVQSVNGEGAQHCFTIHGDGGTASVRLLFCPDTGLLQRIELEGRYGVFGGSMHDRVVWELQRHPRGEDLGAWLDSANTRQAALRELLQSPSLPLPGENWLASLPSLDEDSQTLALSVLYRRHAAAPRAELAALLASKDERVQRLASLLQQASPSPVPDGDDDDPPGTYPYALRSGRFLGTPYLVHIPENYRRGDSPCAVVYLSGGAGLATDAVSTAEPDAGRWGCLLVYPHAAGKMWWEPQMGEVVGAVLDQVATDFHLDTKRVLIAGFSNGATGALLYATRWPQRFSAVISLMGAGGCMASEGGWNLAALRGIPVLLVHGDADKVIDRRCSEEADRRLRKIGARVEFHLLKGRGHDITLASDDGLATAFVTRWLKDTAPSR